MKKQKNKTRILQRFGLITLLFLFGAILITIRLFMTCVINADEWNKVARRQLDVIDTIAPERGNILASNGSILACNMMVWDVMIDLRHPKIQKCTDLPWQAIDSLADYLDAHYPRPHDLASLPKDSMEKCSWRARFRREFAKPKEKWNRSLMLAKGVTLADFDSIGQMNFIKDFYGKSNCPYYKKSRYVRKQPYGSMAHYSIGLVTQDPLRNSELHGYSGLEKDLDSLLYGKFGTAKRVALTNTIGNWNIKEPVRGYDVLTTIDINIQDIFEQEMLTMCQEKGATWATGMIMEVSTGEIKAISNVELLKDGTYGEAYNRIVECYEPGSVIKPISMLIAFEDGLVKSVNDAVDTSPFQKTSDPHAPTVKNMKQVMAWSSNTGVARIIFRGYSNDPSKFRDRWESLGLFERMHTGIAEEKLPRMPKLLPQDSKGNPITMTARHLSLARQAYGYAVEISPLYLLSIYNAIANDGKYVRPHLVRALRDENGRDSVLKYPMIRDQVCSPHTAEMLRECLYEVVWGEGTGRAARDERVHIAGKTGTAFPTLEHSVGYDTSKRRYAFAGFFPYENPKYSCVVLMLAPAHCGSAASLSGGVMRNTAVKMYARGMLDVGSNYAESRNGTTPVLAAGNDQAIKDVRDNLPLRSAKKIHTDGAAKQGTVPSVIGYDAASALAILEKAGLNVRLSGTGRVVAQSIPKGSPLVKGRKILLTLK
jgi:cell division protein FtsI (penicillin-binding protein 3)